MSKHTPEPFYERLSARKYYGKGRIGSVILRNGYPIFHGKPSEVTKLLAKLEGGVSE